MEEICWSQECKRRYLECRRINSEIKKLEKEKKRIGIYYIIDVLAENLSELLNLPYKIDTRYGVRIHFYKDGTTKNEMKYAKSKYTISFSGINPYDYQSKTVQYFNTKEHKWKSLPKSINEIATLIVEKETGWEPKCD